MKADGEDVETIRELVWYANYKVSADVYTYAMAPAKREAQVRVVKMNLPYKSSMYVSQSQLLVDCPDN